MGDYDKPVDASAEVLADLWRRFETDLDSDGWAEYALSLGLETPSEPEGYKGWTIVEAYPDYPQSGYETRGVLYWNGPEEDHGEED